MWREKASCLRLESTDQPEPWLMYMCIIETPLVPIANYFTYHAAAIFVRLPEYTTYNQSTDSQDMKGASL